MSQVGAKASQQGNDGRVVLQGSAGLHLAGRTPSIPRNDGDGTTHQHGAVREGIEELNMRCDVIGDGVVVEQWHLTLLWIGAVSPLSRLWD